MSILDKEISDKIFLADLRKEFLITVKNSIADFKNFNKSNDYNNIRKTAHNLKGISGVFGFQSGSDIARKIQSSIDNKEYKKVKLLITEIIKYFEESVIPELDIKEEK